MRPHNGRALQQAGFALEVLGDSLSDRPVVADVQLRSWLPPPPNGSIAPHGDSRGPTGSAEEDAEEQEERSTIFDDLPLSADILWGSIGTSPLQFFDRRLQAGQLVSGLPGFEHDALGTTRALALSHERCVRSWGVRMCNYSAPLMRLVEVPTTASSAGRQLGQLLGIALPESEGDDEPHGGVNGTLLPRLRSVPSKGRHKSSALQVWLATQASSEHCPLTHARANMFEGRRLASLADALPAGTWAVQPWPASPLAWRHHRFLVRTWVIVPSVLPLRAYMLQDGWGDLPPAPPSPLASPVCVSARLPVCLSACLPCLPHCPTAPLTHTRASSIPYSSAPCHTLARCAPSPLRFHLPLLARVHPPAHIVAKPYTVDQLASNYKDRCAHLWSIAGCSLTHRNRILRTSNDNFADNLVGLPRSAAFDGGGFWRRMVWPALEDATTRALASVALELQQHERALRLSAPTAAYQRVGLLTLDWLIDQDGRPLLFDVDADGAQPTNDLPLSHQYAIDALRLVGAGGYERTAPTATDADADGAAAVGREDGYGHRLERAVNAFCQLRADRAEHAVRDAVGRHAAATPPTAANAHPAVGSQPSVATGAGIGALRCTADAVAALYALVDEAHHSGPYARLFPPVGGRGCGQYCPYFERRRAGGVELAQRASAEDQLMWAFLRAHGALLPARPRLPPQKDKPNSKADKLRARHADGRQRRSGRVASTGS